MKICTLCKKSKPFSEYNKNKCVRDGYSPRCILCVRKVAIEWYFANKDKKRAYDAKRRIEKRHLYRAASKRWSAKHPEKKRADTNCRRRRLRNQMPSWMSPTKMKCFYEQAQRLQECLGIKHDVDHIIPLAGRGISGLHVPWNLQVIPASVNARKSNHYQRNQ